MGTMASQSPASRFSTQPLIQEQIKENIKAPRHWPLCEELTGTGEFPAQRASNEENVSIWLRHHVAQSGPWMHSVPDCVEYLLTLSGNIM